jgi:phosphoribosylaminoimidazole-succinocarboxamide synthase
MPNHMLRLISNCDNADLPFPCPHTISGMSMIVRRAKRVDIECVARGYLSGSGWVEYQQSGSVCGIPLPSGLRESDKLPEPIFTPSTKAASGHDINIGFVEVANLIGEDAARQVRMRRSLLPVRRRIRHGSRHNHRRQRWSLAR